jgi:hypothetical protein
MRVEAITPVLAAAPGERSTCRLRIENTDASPLLYGLRVVGFDESYVLRPPPTPPLPAGASEEVALEFVIPDAFAAGHHSVAVEVTSNRPGSAPVIAAITVTVGAIDDVAMAVVPSTIRGHRRGRFRLDIDNRAATPIELDLAGEGPDLAVRLRPDRVVLRAGERVRTSGKVKGPRHLVGEVRQHSFTVTARSRSSPSYAPATFTQRPLLPRGLRSLVAVLLVVAIWAAAIGAGYLWWTNRHEDEPVAAALVDTDGDGVVDTPGDQMIDTDGDGVPDTLAAVVAEQVAAAADDPGPPQEGGSDLPTRTVVSGTIKAGETGDDAGVGVTLTPMDLGAQPAQPTALRSPPEPLPTAAKLWPHRFGRYQPGGGIGVRQTESVVSTASGPDGAWLFADVAIGQHYELSFAKEGFDTKSFVVTPPADGSPVQMEVVLDPADGAVSGVVVGPSGPLGNVDLVLTDGTLTFNTSSASGRDAGEWSLAAVSTPGTYTLTASARGLGTEVLQVTLEPGEQRDGITIRMRPDVGSISGRVSAGGQPLGGATLTASNGDVTHTTTSLTEGDRGLFHFPQLDSPGRYTVTVSLDGFVTQTRLVTLGGNVGGVDFDLIASTGTITGLVMSSNGGPLPGTNIRVTRDELSFDTTSAAAPDPGSFTIADLPPGSYLVEFSRFDHSSQSQIVNVAAGQVVDLGQIVLTFRERPDIPQTGSLVVRVVNSAGDDLTGATVRLIDVGTGELVREQADTADAQATFEFLDLDIGTYLVEVSKRPTYGDAERRVSIGLGRQELVVPLFLLGQASGRIVDSQTGAELDDYEVTLFRVDTAGNETQVGVPLNPAPGRGPDRDQIRWETPPNSLISGTYRVRVTRPPPGYRVRDDQVIVDGQPAMQFVVLPTDEAPIMLDDLQADILPSLTGAVVVPQRDATGTISFVPLDDDSLEVSLRCGAFGPVSAEPPDGLFDGPDSGPGFDHYFFSAITMGENNLLGQCELTVGAAGYVTVVERLPSPLLPSDGGPDSPDKVVNVALFRPHDVGGRAYWIDVGNGGVEVGASGVTVRTEGQVIVGFDPTDGAGDPTPQSAPTPLSTSTAATGGWVFIDPKQVFGTTEYRFEDSRYEPRAIGITIDQTGRVAAPIDPLDPLDLDPATLDVELDALGGQVGGFVVLRTIKGTPAFPGTTPNLADFEMQLGNGVTTLVDDSVDPFFSPHNGLGIVETTDPGTYQPVWDPAPNHVPFDAASLPPLPTVFQPPGTSALLFASTYVEQGRIDVAVRERGAAVGATPPNAAVTVAHTATGAPGDTVDFSRTLATVGGDVTVSELPVNMANPEGFALAYNVTPSVAGFDVTDGQYTVTTETGTTGPIACTVCSPSLGIRAGGEQRVLFEFPRFGSISGNVLGRAGPATTPLTLGAGSLLTVTATRVAEPDGTPLTIPDPPITAAVDPTDPSGFSVSGAPGFYTIAVGHPHYQPLDPAEAPPPDLVSLGAYRMTNGTPNDITAPWLLDIEPGILDITALENTINGGVVGGAAVGITGPNGYSANLNAGSDGRLVVDDLLPGTYRITIRRLAAGEDEFFPVIVTVVVPEGADDAARTRVVRAPLPRIGGWLAGTVSAENLEGNLVPLPVVTVGRTYTPPDVHTGTPAGAPLVTIANEATEGDINRPSGEPNPSVTVAADPAGGPQRYLFSNLATGAHQLTFSTAAPGYQGVAGVTESVTDLVPPDPGEVNVDPVVFVADNRGIDVTVETPGGVRVTDATVTLTHPDGDPAVPVTANVNGVYTFTGVPPEIAAYTVTVIKPLHTDTAASVTVSPGTGNVAATVVLPADRAVISGVARKQQTASSSGPLTNEGFARLIALPAGTEVASIIPDGQGRYTFEVNAADLATQYQVRVDLNGFASRSSAPFTPVLGIANVVPDVVVPALATFNVTVSGAPGDATTVVVAEPASQAGVTPTRSGQVFSFRVDPGFAYRFTVSASGFVSETVPDTAQMPAPGQTVALAAALDPRTITGTLSPGVAGIGVRARSGGTEITATSGSGGTYTLSGVGVGTWTIVAERAGTGRGVIERTIASNASASVTGADIELDPRPVSVSFSTSPAGASVTLLDGTTPVATGTVSPLTGATEDDFPLTWSATLAGHDPESGNVPPLPAGGFDVESFTVTIPLITLTPE